MAKAAEMDEHGRRGFQAKQSKGRWAASNNALGAAATVMRTFDGAALSQTTAHTAHFPL
jgi:hypothetical protein